MLSTKAGDAELLTHAVTYFTILPMLKNLKYLHHLIQHTGQHRAGKKPDILDIFISKTPSNLYCAVNNILDLNSDHSSVILNVDATPQINSVSHSLFSPSTNRYTFHNIIAQKVDLSIKLKTEHDIDEAINNLSELIHSAASLSNTLTTSKHSVQNLTPLPEQIRSLIVEKRRARAVYQRTRLPSHKNAYNKLANSLKKTLAKNKADTLEQKLTNLSFSDGSLWKETKKLLSIKTPSTPLKKPDHTLASSDTDKAEVLKAHLHETFQPHHNILIPQFVDEVKAGLDLPSTSNHLEKYFTPNEIKQAIQKYSLKKSPGYDLLTAEVARCLPKKAIVLVTYIFNACLRLSYFPILWKFSKIILFPKPDKPLDDPSSYRPISLLPFLSKIFERLILKRMTPYIVRNNILPNTQFGFRPSHSTIHQAHRIVDAISFSLEKKLYCTCVFLDVSQAFDRVWHDGLLYKLKSFLPHPLFLLIKSYLTDRHFQVHYRSAYSEITKINAGVPQGGILSPTLFNIYVADQPTTPQTMVADYADDKVILSISENPVAASSNLQLHLCLMSNWYDKWRIKINQNKSSHTTFTLKKGICPTVTLNNIPIPTSDTIKYLGLNLDKRLTWKNHIRTKRLTLNARMRILNPLISRNNKTSLKVKLLIYKTLLKPIWTYGIQLWGSAKKSNTNKIQVFQNLALRRLSNAPPYVSNLTLHNDFHIKTINEEAQSFYLRYRTRLLSHQNPLIKTLSSQTLPGNPRRRLKRKWCRDLLQL
uniref:Putative RNA-directed DNA polymerase n=1 Tax=Sipha flava TaxID=143950 RepID=A0A2S2Q7E7_9HEMI